MRSICAAVFGLQLIVGTALHAQAPPATNASSSGSKVERIKVHGASLEGNLEGDDPNRDVVVYLPPTYSKTPAGRYPVVYFLHGYGVGVDAYVRLLKLQEAADNAIAAGAKEMILVLPDAFTVYSGSMYSNSPTTGDWEDYISHDLVAYIDSHYRTLANRDNRGLSGHSMGGYGTMRIGMKHPEVFSALYSMSACCLMNYGAPQPNPARGEVSPGERGQRGGALANAQSAQAAAWAPNPMNPPKYFDLPTKDGEVQPLVAAKWPANSPLVMVDQYVPSLKRYRAIAVDVGDKDPLGASNLDLDKALTRLGIAHTFEQYEGDHGNRIAARFVSHLLPFFSKQLSAPSVAASAQPGRQQACDRECLRGFITQYLNAMVAHNPKSLPLAAGARFTEDTKTLPLGEGLWKNASSLQSYRQDFLDVREGQAATHVVVEEGGNPVMLALRLKITDRKISEIETMVTRNRTEGALFSIDALTKSREAMNVVPDASQKMSRADLIRIAEYYPAGLKIGGTFEAVHAPFAPGAYRIENGSTMAGVGARAGSENILTQRIIAHPEVSYRIAAVDEELGIVLMRLDFGDTNSYGAGNALACFEAFKVYGGQIHAVEAFIRIMPANTPSGWNYEVKKPK